MSLVFQRLAHTAAKKESASAFLDQLLSKVSESTKPKAKKKPFKKQAFQKEGLQKKQPRSNGVRGTGSDFGKAANSKQKTVKRGRRVAGVETDVLGMPATAWTGAGAKGKAKARNNQRRAPVMQKILQPRAFSLGSVSANSLLQYLPLIPANKAMRTVAAAKLGVDSASAKQMVLGEYQELASKLDTLPKKTPKLVYNFGVVQNLLNNNGSFDMGAKSRAFDGCVGIKSVRDLVRE